MKDIVLSFDLDFTLIDNTTGILNAFRYTFETYNLPGVHPKKLISTIGMPLHKAFKKFTDFDQNKLVKTFRDFYSWKGMYQVELYPAVPKLLNRFKAHNLILGVVTSKKQEIAEKLLNHLAIRDYFTFVIGETDKIKKKTDPEVKSFFFNTYPKHSYIIVGDNVSDKKLAIMLGSPFIGLLSGTSSKSDLKKDSKIPTLILEDISKLTITQIIEFINRK
jgi:phosphoglycolate phosphatase